METPSFFATTGLSDFFVVAVWPGLMANSQTLNPNNNINRFIRLPRDQPKVVVIHTVFYTVRQTKLAGLA
jgi:hypothetical protein